MNSCFTCTIGFVVASCFVASTLAQETQSSENSKPVLIQDGHVIVVVPANRTSVSAYSIERNIWKRIEFDSPLSADAQPVVFQGMVALKVDHIVYCFSAKTGAWDNVKLEMGSDAVPVVQSNCISLKDNDSFYVFGVNSETWSGVDLQTGKYFHIQRASGEQSDEPKSR